ncbi:4'-phosphopantetheinyl transferase [Chryseobacterium defluvii]|uniref:4'-phosphopantetheinyl transferase n=1 Tax=Chryseobacterium defluvii TaxID=160396 RepID=A0A840KAV2_9FLAO|nr:4'-phosphopantetheinyl transferase superfamily protein [Chryseobacterium defluvii]MBB4804730.1 4'-phosphopantetheinyl transferase [Chryseobacterium defluvii]
MIILYTFIEEGKHQYLLDKYAEICSKEFNAKILKYRRWQDAQLSLLGRVLLRYGLNHYFDIKDFEMSRTSDHKPFITDHAIHFNISHAGNLVACCISRSPIGIDVEYIDHKINYEDFKSQMTSGEFSKVYHSEDKIKSFFTYWTEKEAIIKAHGRGLLIPLRSFEVFQDQAVIENEKFFLKEIFIDKEYQCYVASNEDIRQQKNHIEHINLNKL